MLAWSWIRWNCACRREKRSQAFRNLLGNGANRRVRETYHGLCVEPEDGEGARKQTVHILIVEDSPLLQKAYGLAFPGREHVLITTANGRVTRCPKLVCPPRAPPSGSSSFPSLSRSSRSRNPDSLERPDWFFEPKHNSRLRKFARRNRPPGCPEHCSSVRLLETRQRLCGDRDGLWTLGCDR